MATITLAAFKTATLGGTYGNPPPTLVRNSGTFRGQCVSFVRQYLSACFNTNWGAVGNAVDYANKANQARFKSIGFEWKTDQKFQDGDILVWGDDKGNWTGKEGHIAIWYKGQILNQNYNGSLKVSLNGFFSQGYLGRYTKGDTMAEKITKVQVTDLIRGTLGREPNSGDLSNVGKKTYDEFRKYLYGSSMYKLRIKMATEARLDPTTYLPTEVRNAYKPPTYEPVTETLYRKK